MKRHRKAIRISQSRMAWIFVIGVGILGTIFIVTSRAATPTTSLEPENGTVTGNVTTVPDSTASEGKAIKYGAAPTTPPSGPTSPSGQSIPTSSPSGWQQVFSDDFTSTTPDSHWSFYNGKFGGGIAHYSSKAHAYNADGVMHLLGKQDASSYNGTQWYTGAACLCAGTGSWVQAYDARVTFRWRVVNTGIVSTYLPKYAFLRWPKSEVWPKDGEEDFLEGALGPGASTTVSMHAANSQGQNYNAYQKSVPNYGPTDWHTVTYYRQGYHAVLIVDDVTKMDYTGTESSLPTTLKHIVFQQECDYGGCPTAGTSDVQIDWVVVYIPS